MAKGITFFSKLSSVIANSTFFIKNADFDEIISRVVLKNISEPESGVQIDNLQRYTNELGDTTGYTEGDANRKVYGTNYIITDGQNRKEALEAFDISVQTNIDDIASNLVLIDINTKLVVAEQIVTDGQKLALSIVKSSQELRLVGDSAPVVLDSVPFTVQPLDGAIVVLVGHDDTNTVRINDNNATQFGCWLNGDAILKKYSTLTLIYNAELERFVEQGRNF